MTAVYRPAFRGSRRTVLATSVVALCLFASSRAAFEITTGVGNTAQNFDSLLNTGTNNTFTNDTTLTPGDSTLEGWSLYNFSGSPIGTYNAGAGTSTTGNFYSFGSAGSTERAFGGLGSGGSYFGTPASGAVAGYMAFAATNSSSATLTSFTLEFNGEQWRNANTSPQTMVLEYGFGATLDAVTWTAPSGTFNWASPVVGGTAGAVDGNVAGLVSNLGGTINGLNWATGQTLWLRWTELNDTGNDHALAIDNFSLSWAGAVIVPLYWDINGATAGIGGTGTWNGTNLNWNSALAGTGAPQAVDPSKRLVFGGSGGTITVDAAGVAANIGMEFEAPYTLNGGPITLGNIPTVSVSAPVTINAPLAGTSGLTKLGPDTLTLTNGSNTFTGVITINAGALAVTGDTQLGAADNDIILSGGLLALGNTFIMNASRALTGGGGSVSSWGIPSRLRARSIYRRWTSAVTLRRTLLAVRWH
jgi:autotransporter-associated beta strand protein